MHRFFTLAAGLTLFAFTAEAQLVKGTRLLGGSIGYNRTTRDFTIINKNPNYSFAHGEESSYRSFDLAPQAGVFIDDNWAAGISLGYSSVKNVSPYYSYTGSAAPIIYKQTNTNSSYQVAPYLRYYYMPTATFGVFGHLAAFYNKQSSQTKITQPGSDVGKGRGHELGLYLTPKLVFFPIDKLGLELSLGGIGYSSRTDKTTSPISTIYEQENTTSSFGANFGFNQLSVGASYYLAR